MTDPSPAAVPRKAEHVVAEPGLVAEPAERLEPELGEVVAAERVPAADQRLRVGLDHGHGHGAREAAEEAERPARAQGVDVLGGGRQHDDAHAGPLDRIGVDAQGVERRMTVNFTKTGNNAWDVEVVGPDSATPLGTVSMTFDDNGKILTPATAPSFDYTPPGSATPVTFTLDLPMDTLTFNADVVVPLTLVVHTEAPTTIRMELTMPPAEKVQLTISPSTRRGAVFQKITGLESELRRFLPQVLATELAKPYIQKAMRLDMEDLIERSWDDLSSHFLPQGPADRKA